jgi:putative hydrolase of the HAD superfamily
MRDGFIPRCILFDAVGTLIDADPPVAQAYHDVGCRYGSQISPAEVRQRFLTAFAKHTSDDGLASAERERWRWQRVIADVFPEQPAAHEKILDELWAHFASPSAWRLFDDAAPTIDELQARGYRLGVASNFDERLVSVCRGHASLAELELFWSSDIGYSKPHPLFFARVSERLGLAPQEILLVGDDVAADFRGAKRAGWRAVHLDRSADGSPHADVCQSLTELLTRLAPTT